MRLTLHKEKGFWRAGEVQEIQLDFLRMAADDAALGDFPEGRERLYPSPMAAKDAAREEEFLNDWHEYVGSDLEMQFAGDVGTFLSDIDEAKKYGLSPDSEENLFRLDIPIEHGQAWFSTLNQARLMLDLKHKLHTAEQPLDEDVVREIQGSGDDASRIFVLMRYEFYSWIQEWLVQHVL
jgi:hypothetical protein